jgi:hypothetical protein
MINETIKVAGNLDAEDELLNADADGFLTLGLDTLTTTLTPLSDGALRIEPLASSIFCWEWGDYFDIAKSVWNHPLPAVGWYRWIGTVSDPKNFPVPFSVTINLDVRITSGNFTFGFTSYADGWVMPNASVFGFGYNTVTSKYNLVCSKFVYDDEKSDFQNARDACYTHSYRFGQEMDYSMIIAESDDIDVTFDITNRHVYSLTLHLGLDRSDPPGGSNGYFVTQLDLSVDGIIIGTLYSKDLYMSLADFSFFISGINSGDFDLYGLEVYQ